MTPLARPCTTSLESPVELCPGAMPDGIDAFHSMSLLQQSPYQSQPPITKPDPATARLNQSNATAISVHPQPNQARFNHPQLNNTSLPTHRFNCQRGLNSTPISFYKVAVGSPFRCWTIAPTTKSNQHSHRPTKTVN